MSGNDLLVTISLLQINISSNVKFGRGARLPNVPVNRGAEAGKLRDVKHPTCQHPGSETIIASIPRP